MKGNQEQLLPLEALLGMEVWRRLVEGASETKLLMIPSMIWTGTQGKEW
jgi:hypothetical protein